MGTKHKYNDTILSILNVAQKLVKNMNIQTIQCTTKIHTKLGHQHD